MKEGVVLRVGGFPAQRSTGLLPSKQLWRRSGVFIVTFEHNFTPSSSNVSIVNCEQVNAGKV